MRIARLRVHNWLCFRGEHELVLGPKVYAVVAQTSGNAERSNWLGKTSLLEAVTFALYGRHRHRTEDEWITRGEADGFVEIELDGGTRITRKRQRGKRTELQFHAVDRAKAAIQEEAQELVTVLLGLGEADFLNTCAFEQRQMAKFILTEPSKRMDTISAWFQLGPLEKCSDRAGEEVSKLVIRADALRSAITANENVLAQMGEADQVLARKAADGVERRRGEVGRLQDEIQKNATLMSAHSRVEEFERLVGEGTKLRDEVAKMKPEALRTEHEVAQRAWSETGGVVQMAQKELRSRRELALGQFDGKCPIASIECPAVTKINAQRKENTTAFQKAEAAFQKAEAEHDAAMKRWRAAETVLHEAERKESRLHLLREQAAGMMGDVETAKSLGEPENPALLRQKLEMAQERLAEALRAQAAADQAIKAKDQAEAALGQLRAELARLEGILATWRESGVVFKAAQRQVAEGALAEIEHGANHALGTCGIDLGVRISWTREGQGLARVCEACGNPFPTSARVKVCPRCNAGRGPLLVNKLEVILTDKSGAAEDLGGAAIQLAASAWLRRDRGSEWGTALLDEPFGQLDRANRRAFGAHLATMLRGEYGFDQALVVAHSPDVLDALPGRIEIMSDGGVSRVQVVA